MTPDDIRGLLERARTGDLHDPDRVEAFELILEDAPEIISQLLDELEAEKHQIDKAWEMLNICGVPKSRTDYLSTAVDVLATRSDINITVLRLKAHFSKYPEEG